VVKVAAGILVIGVAIVLGFGLHHDNPLSRDVVVDSLWVKKSDRIMVAYSKGRAVKTYDVALGEAPVGDKVMEGDRRTPEGHYRIFAKTTESRFHMNLGVSYPDSSDRAQAQAQGYQPGGDIKIHGLHNALWFLGRYHRLTDWTAGCIAVTNDEIEELYHAVPVGTPITIEP